MARNAQTPSERAAQSCLVEFLAGNLPNQQAFFSVFRPKIGEWFGNLKKPVTVRENVGTSSGGFIDVLLTQGGRALVVELKITHRENPFQYTAYRKCVVKEGYEVLVVGILSNSRAMRGRARLVEAILAIVADARIPWGYLLDRLYRQGRARLAVKRLRAQLEEIYPGVSKCRSAIPARFARPRSRVPACCSKPP